MINSYIWKYKNKTDRSMEVKKLIDMSENELQTIYGHCKSMLYNNSKSEPGRYLVINEINNQINDCTAELAVRWFCLLKNDKDQLVYSRFSLLGEIKLLLEKYKKDENQSNLKLQDFYSGLPTDFNSVLIDSIMKACRDTLGKFNRNHITKSFIIRQGIWFTPLELTEFKEIEKLRNISEILNTIKERLNINNSYDLQLKSTGLNYEQFRALLNLKVGKKYSELTTMQLETLKDKILFILEETVLHQISEWKGRMEKIEEVCKFKNYKL